MQVIAELLAEDRVAALQWPAEHLAGEARRRGILVPSAPQPPRVSLHLVE
ncbi:MAG TPA: hypothetical protein PLU22_04085 [Polyangiaceae bacterium]|nr:hypothetical protein [Polyangiaceae bacterium]